VTCSIGVASFPADGQDRRSLMVAADSACYLAKHGGRDRVATAAMAQSAELASDGIGHPLSGLLDGQPEIEALSA
jgi:predicted signal transduction protein with EAL and GGDEF domain